MPGINLGWSRPRLLFPFEQCRIDGGCLGSKRFGVYSACIDLQLGMALTEATLTDTAVRSNATSGGGLGLSKVRFRNIRKSDFGILQSFVQHLSPETSYKRLLSPRMPTDDELRRWSAIDPATECALVAVTGAGADDHEEIIGVARFVVESPGEADFAIVMADAWQRLGLGRELMSRLIDAARRYGLRRVSGDVLATNTGMLALGRRAGFVVARRSGIVSTLSLDTSSAEVGSKYQEPDNDTDWDNWKSVRDVA